MTDYIQWRRIAVACLLALCAASVHAAVPVVRINSNMGVFFIELHPDEAPATVANFLSYVRDGSYEQSIIHRSVPGFVIQGGGFVFSEGGPFLLDSVPAKPPVVNEFNISNTRATVAMAKLANQPNSATSEWFVNLVDNSDILDPQNGGFTVFGTVRAGMAVVDAIAALQRWILDPFTDLPLINFANTALPTADEFVLISTVDEFELIDSPLGSALPGGRRVQNGTTATTFATIINADDAVAASCGIVPGTSVPADFTFQTTDAATNQPTGEPNTPVDIPAGGSQSFVLSFTPTAAFEETEIELQYVCGNSDPAAVLTGVNTFNLGATDNPTADVIALSLTPSANGVVEIPGQNGTGVFSVASTNIGAAGQITATVDTGDATLPVELFICETDAVTGECITPLATSASRSMATDDTATYTVLVQGMDVVEFAPAVNRVYVRFTNAAGDSVGTSSVASQTAI